jgi:hypothetical protein
MVVKKEKSKASRSGFLHLSQILKNSPHFNPLRVLEILSGVILENFQLCQIILPLRRVRMEK